MRPLLVSGADAGRVVRQHGDDPAGVVDVDTTLGTGQTIDVAFEGTANAPVRVDLRPGPDAPGREGIWIDARITGPAGMRPTNAGRHGAEHSTSFTPATTGGYAVPLLGNQGFGPVRARVAPPRR